MARYLTRSELERIAGTFVGKYYALIRQRGVISPAVDPEVLARDVLGLDVRYLPLCDDGSILGLSSFDRFDIRIFLDGGESFMVELGGRDIVLDTGLLAEGSTGRRNFTMAHEVSHHILAALFPEDYGMAVRHRAHILYREKDAEREWEEWQADAMAAAILMPEALIRQDMELFGIPGYGVPESAGASWDNDRFGSMAAHMGVSRQALRIRLRQLQMPKGGPGTYRGGERWEHQERWER